MQFSKRLGLLDVCDVCSFVSLEFADVDNLVLDGVLDEIAGFMKVEFLEDVILVVFYGAGTDKQAVGNLFGGLAFGHKPEYVCFALA